MTRAFSGSCNLTELQYEQSCSDRIKSTLFILCFKISKTTCRLIYMHSTFEDFRSSPQWLAASTASHQFSSQQTILAAAALLQLCSNGKEPQMAVVTREGRKKVENSSFLSLYCLGCDWIFVLVFSIKMGWIVLFPHPEGNPYHLAVNSQLSWTLLVMEANWEQQQDQHKAYFTSAVIVCWLQGSKVAVDSRWTEGKMVCWLNADLHCSLLDIRAPSQQTHIIFFHFFTFPIIFKISLLSLFSFLCFICFIPFKEPRIKGWGVRGWEASSLVTFGADSRVHMAPLTQPNYLTGG